jgi:hypothetical protein
MGAVALAYDMVGMGDSTQISHKDWTIVYVLEGGGTVLDELKKMRGGVDTGFRRKSPFFLSRRIDGRLL